MTTAFQQERAIPAPNRPQDSLGNSWAISYSITGALAETGWSRSYLYLLIGAGLVQSYTTGKRRYVIGTSLRNAFVAAVKGELDYTQAELQELARKRKSQ
jgi:hypothetical protein